MLHWIKLAGFILVILDFNSNYQRRREEDVETTATRPCLEHFRISTGCHLDWNMFTRKEKSHKVNWDYLYLTTLLTILRPNSAYTNIWYLKNITRTSMIWHMKRKENNRSRFSISFALINWKYNTVKANSHLPQWAVFW